MKEFFDVHANQPARLIAVRLVVSVSLGLEGGGDEVAEVRKLQFQGTEVGEGSDQGMQLDGVDVEGDLEGGEVREGRLYGGVEEVSEAVVVQDTAEEQAPLVPFTAASSVNRSVE